MFCVYIVLLLEFLVYIVKFKTFRSYPFFFRSKKFSPKKVPALTRSYKMNYFAGAHDT